MAWWIWPHLCALRLADTDLDLNLHLHNGRYDGEERGVLAARTDLPRLERHVDVAVLDQCERAELARLERDGAHVCRARENRVTWEPSFEFLATLTWIVQCGFVESFQKCVQFC